MAVAARLPLGFQILEDLMISEEDVGPQIFEVLLRRQDIEISRPHQEFGELR